MKKRKIRWDRVFAILFTIGLLASVGYNAIESHVNPTKHERIVLCVERGHC